MDRYSVPKKINRHVLKALYYKNGTGFKTSNFSEIVDLVEVSMRNNIPVRDLHSAVRQSLQNMALLGVIGKSGTKFYVRDLNSSPVFPKRIKKKLFGLNDRRNGVSKSKLDPNLRKRVASDDSLSGCDIRKTLKRFRSSRPIMRRGQKVPLTKARVSPVKINLNTDIELDRNPSETVKDAEDESETTCDDVNILLKNRFFSDISVNENQENSEEKQNTKHDQDSQTSQNTNDEQDRATTPKTDPNSNIVSTAEQKADEKTEEEPNSAQNP